MELVWPVRQTLPATSMTVVLPEAAANSGAAKSRATKIEPDGMQIPHQRAMGQTAFRMGSSLFRAALFPLGPPQLLQQRRRLIHRPQRLSNPLRRDVHRARRLIRVKVSQRDTLQIPVQHHAD